MQTNRVFCEAALERDNFLSGTEAVEFGIVDEVVDKRAVPEKDNEGKEAK